MEVTGNKIVLVKAPDWQMLYVNGQLEVQAERLHFDYVMTILLKNNWNYGMQLEVKDVDYKWFDKVGENPPEDLSEVKFSTQS